MRKWDGTFCKTVHLVSSINHGKQRGRVRVFYSETINRSDMWLLLPSHFKEAEGKGIFLG
jgi:hypothetical protein